MGTDSSATDYTLGNTLARASISSSHPPPASAAPATPATSAAFPSRGFSCRFVEILVSQNLIRGFSQLPVDQLRVRAVGGKQLVVCAGLHDVSIAKHTDFVSIFDRRQPVGDKNDRRVFQLNERIQSVLHQGFRLGVERGRRLIQKKNLRLAQHHASDSDPLALPAAQAHTLLANACLKPMRELFDELPRVRADAGSLELFLCVVVLFHAISDVLFDVVACAAQQLSCTDSVWKHSELVDGPDDGT
jgi:hypothetical protein